MKRKRRYHSPSYKANIALAVVRGEKTMPKLVVQFDVHTNQILGWQRKLLDQADQLDERDSFRRKMPSSRSVCQALSADDGTRNLEQVLERIHGS